VSRYDNGFGSGLRPIGLDPRLTGRAKSAKRGVPDRPTRPQWLVEAAHGKNDGGQTKPAP
jgi:hypothetical protein